MDFIIYPDYLPHPHFTSQGVKQQSNILRSEMSSGRTRQRRRFFVVPSYETVEWRLSPDKAASFLGWVDHAIMGGVRWFRLNQRTELGVLPLDVRLSQHPLENQKQRGGKFIYSVKCEIRKYPVQSEEQTARDVLYPYTLEEFVEGVDLSRYYENN